MAPFSGAKLAILVGDRLLTILRDDRPDISWPGYWDLPGGGREGAETPAACALRETHEELGLALPEAALTWGRAFPRWDGTAAEDWLFVTRDDRLDLGRVRFGDEGQRWEAMPVSEFLAGPGTIPHLAERLRIYLAGA
jgi:8-oxo-dGTP diphosphatase